ncbi:hypothetical protein ACIBBG_16280 [Micromonospora chersina]|uniref:hypothetical protein n=1 Tax=Micromonospora chersina TaxID=47854 RepID=UPI0037B7D535
MSNWRINLGVGPLRYVRAVGGRKKPAAAGDQQKMTPLGCLITLVVTVGVIYLCCWGGVAWVGSQP